jgi:hypothetical protein
MDDLLPLIQKQKLLLSKVQVSLKKIATPQESAAKRVSILRKELAAAEKSVKDLLIDPSILQLIQSNLKKARDELQQQEEQLKSKFGLELEQSLKAHNLTLTGNYPKLKTSFYTIDIDIPADKVTLWFGEIEKLDTTKTVPEKVVDSLLKINEEITKRPFDEKAFLRDIRTAYQMYITASHKSVGNDAPLPEIHALLSLLMQKEKFRKNPVKQNFSEYTRAMFSYDLSRVKNRIIDQNELTLITATRTDTRDKGNFFWIPPSDNTPGRYLAGIKISGVA